MAFFCYIPGAKQILSAVQYSSSVHTAAAKHVESAWQVRGPPMVSCLQDVKPVTVEQSDVTAQITEIIII